ncbi:MAG: hypothetical protein ACYCO5_14850 [Acidobacteriaceae bacterium]
MGIDLPPSGEPLLVFYRGFGAAYPHNLEPGSLLSVLNPDQVSRFQFMINSRQKCSTATYVSRNGVLHELHALGSKPRYTNGKLDLDTGLLATFDHEPPDEPISRSASEIGLCLESIAYSQKMPIGHKLLDYILMVFLFPTDSPQFCLNVRSERIVFIALVSTLTIGS